MNGRFVNGRKNEICSSRKNKREGAKEVEDIDSQGERERERDEKVEEEEEEKKKTSDTEVEDRRFFFFQFPKLRSRCPLSSSPLWGIDTPELIGSADKHQMPEAERERGRENGCG